MSRPKIFTHYMSVQCNLVKGKRRFQILTKEKIFKTQYYCRMFYNTLIFVVDSWATADFWVSSGFTLYQLIVQSVFYTFVARTRETPDRCTIDKAWEILGFFFFLFCRWNITGNCRFPIDLLCARCSFQLYQIDRHSRMTSLFTVSPLSLVKNGTPIAVSWE